MWHPIKHFVTITKHRHKVIAHCRKAGILWQGLRHDLSKYSPIEFFSGAKYYVGTRSPNELEREKFGYSKAWLHHKGRNRHHFEYWQDAIPAEHKPLAPVEMPLRYAAEMFCDRVAASKIYKGNSYTNASAWEYYAPNRDVLPMHPNTKALLEKWLLTLKDQGEDAAFALIKQELKDLRKNTPTKHPKKSDDFSGTPKKNVKA